MIFPAISLLPTQHDFGPSKQLIRTKSCGSFSTITTAEEIPGDSCDIKKKPLRQQSFSVLANALLPLEISFPNKPLPPMPRQLMEKARSIPELEDDYFEDDDDDDDDDGHDDYFEDDSDDDSDDDNDDDDQVLEIVFLPDDEIVFLPAADDHLPPSSANATTTVPPPLYTHSRKMESDPQPEEPCRYRPAIRRGPSVGLQEIRVPARSFEPVLRTLPSCAGQVLQEQRELLIPARSFEPELFGGTRFEL